MNLMDAGLSCRLLELPVQRSKGKLLKPCTVQVLCVVRGKLKLSRRRDDMPHWDWARALIDGLSDHNFQILQRGRNIGQGENASPFRRYESICDSSRQIDGTTARSPARDIACQLVVGAFRRRSPIVKPTPHPDLTRPERRSPR